MDIHTNIQYIHLILLDDDRTYLQQQHHIEKTSQCYTSILMLHYQKKSVWVWALVNLIL